MKQFLIITLVSALFADCAHAQFTYTPPTITNGEIEVTAHGTLNQIIGETDSLSFDSTVQLGTPFTLTFVLDPNAQAGNSSSGRTDYGAVFSSVTVGDYSYSQWSGGVSLINNYDGQGQSGYVFGGNAQGDYNPFDGIVFGLNLVTDSPIAADSISDIQQYPVSIFDAENTFFLLATPFNYSTGVMYPEMSGSIDSYSVNVVGAPEPGTTSLLAAGLVLLGAFKFRKYLSHR